MASKTRALPHVVAVAPVLYDQVLVTGPRGNKLVTLKGIDPKSELATSDTLRHLKSGSLDLLTAGSRTPRHDHRGQTRRRRGAFP